MKWLTGQAGRAVVQIIHRTGMIVLTLFVVAFLAVGALAYRLSLGPLEIPWAATRLANAVSGEDVEVHIGKAELAWAGYKRGSRAPLFLQLGEVSVRNTAGAPLADIPEARLVFSISALFARRAPIFVTSQNALLMGSNAPVSLLASFRMAAGFTLSNATLWVTFGPGMLGPPGFGEPLASGRFLLTITPRDVRLDHGVLDLQAFGHNAPVLTIAATAHKSGAWHGAMTLRTAGIQDADLPHYWPAQFIPITRGWVMQNITAGSAADASFTLGLSAPLHLAGLHVDSATGSFKAQDATLTWLPGVQPITGLTGTFRLIDRDNIEIAADTGHLGGITLTGAGMHIANVSKKVQTATLNIPVSGTVHDALVVLNGPHLGLLKNAPPSLQDAAGDMTGTVKVALPLQPHVAIGDVRLNVTTLLTDVSWPLSVRGLDLSQARLTVDSTLQKLSIAGNGQIAGQPASVTVAANFGAGTVIFDAKAMATPAGLRAMGLDTGDVAQGEMPVAVHLASKAGHDGTLTVNADMTPAALSLPIFGWSKPAGTPGRLSVAASLSGNDLAGIKRIDSIDAQAPGLTVDTAMVGKAIDLTYVKIGRTQGSGSIVPPASRGQPWVFRLAGNALDLSSQVKSPDKPENESKMAAAPATPSGFLWTASADFGELILANAPAPELRDFAFSGNGQGNSVFAATASALVDAGAPLTLGITPAPGSQPGYDENLTLRSADTGQLLRAMGAYDDLSGGQLDFVASYGVARPISGLTRISQFRLLNAPAIGKFLQAVTVLGIPEAASGPGLLFNRLVAPFAIDGQVMTLKGARAYSAALGFTASGTIDLNVSRYDIHGTIVPAYALNALPGKIPIIGKLFSPEKGGGLFAMRYSMTGPISDPKVKINPLSALTPGFLRGIFGMGSEAEAK